MAQAVELLLSNAVPFDSQASKGGIHDLTNKADTTAEGVSKDKKGQDSNVRC